MFKTDYSFSALLNRLETHQAQFICEYIFSHPEIWQYAIKNQTSLREQLTGLEINLCQVVCDTIDINPKD